MRFEPDQLSEQRLQSGNRSKSEPSDNRSKPAKPRKRRFAPPDWIRNFFHIVVLILLWEGYRRLAEAYLQAVIARFLIWARKEDVLSILTRGDWQNVLDVPPPLRQAPGWLFVVAALVLLIIGGFFLWGYVVASRRLSEKFWATFEARMRKVLREENQSANLPVPETDAGEDTAADADDGQTTRVEIRYHIDDKGRPVADIVARWRVYLQRPVKLPVRRLNSPRIVDSEPPLQLPEDLGDQDQTHPAP